MLGQAAMAKKSELILNRFTITAEIATDGISSAYLADDSEGGRVSIWALPIEAIESWDTISAVEARAEQYSEVSCASLPRFVGYFSDDSSDDPAIYFVDEHVCGDSLESIVETGGPLSEGETAAMLNDLLEGLASLHQLSPPVVHGAIHPASIVKDEKGGYRFSGLPLSELLPGAQTRDTRQDAARDAYIAPEQGSGRAVKASDIFSLGMSAVYSVTGKHPDSLPANPHPPAYRAPGQGEALDQIIDAMIEPDAADRAQSATEILSWLSESDRTPSTASRSEAGVIPGSGVEIESLTERDRISVYNPAASRAESLLIGFFLDLWASKPWLIILIAAAISAGPIAIPLIIFLFHPKSKILLNRAYAKYRDVFLTLGQQGLSVSDQVKPVEYAEIASYEIHENPNGSGVQLETILRTQDGKETRFYLNSLSRVEARRIKKLIDSRLTIG
jgi:serine/threonine protein kinase